MGNRANRHVIGIQIPAIGNLVLIIQEVFQTGVISHIHAKVKGCTLNLVAIFVLQGNFLCRDSSQISNGEIPVPGKVLTFRVPIGRIHRIVANSGSITNVTAVNDATMGAAACKGSLSVAVHGKVSGTHIDCNPLGAVIRHHLRVDLHLDGRQFFHCYGTGGGSVFALGICIDRCSGDGNRAAAVRSHQAIGIHSSQRSIAGAPGHLILIPAGNHTGGQLQGIFLKDLCCGGTHLHCKLLGALILIQANHRPHVVTEIAELRHCQGLRMNGVHSVQPIVTVRRKQQITGFLVIVQAGSLFRTHGRGQAEIQIHRANELHAAVIIHPIHMNRKEIQSPQLAEQIIAMIIRPVFIGICPGIGHASNGSIRVRIEIGQGSFFRRD